MTLWDPDDLSSILVGIRTEKLPRSEQPSSAEQLRPTGCPHPAALTVLPASWEWSRNPQDTQTAALGEVVLGGVETHVDVTDKRTRKHAKTRSAGRFYSFRLTVECEVAERLDVV